LGKGLAEESATERTTKIDAGEFPVTTRRSNVFSDEQKLTLPEFRRKLAAWQFDFNENV
jgi:hypothetical protein